MRLRYLDQQGGALLIVMAVMLLLTIAAMMAVKTAQTDIDLTFNQLHSDQAFYVAEAGLVQAFVTLNGDNDWNAGYSAVTFEDGVYSVAVVDSFTDVAMFDTIIIRSTGLYDAAVANIEAICVPVYKQPFQWAMFALDSIEMGNGTCTDSYNSDSGDYISTRDLTDGDVASNGTMDFINNVEIGGDASSAVEGGLTIDATCDVYGDTTTKIDPYEFDPIADSEYVWAQSVSQAPAGFSGDYTYDAGTQALSLSTNDTLVLGDGVYFFSDIDLAFNSHIEIASGAAVSIYMTGDLTIGNNSTVNASGVPGDCLIFSKGSSFTIGMSTQVNAAFYGEDVDVSISNDVNYFGSIFAASVDIINSACVHYDLALRDYKLGKTGVIEMIGWKQL